MFVMLELLLHLLPIEASGKSVANLYSLEILERVPARKDFHRASQTRTI